MNKLEEYMIAVEAERRFHDQEYAKAEHESKLPASSCEFAQRFEDIAAKPFWQSCQSYYSDARKLSLTLANPSGSWNSVRVLDVGCGLGELALGLGLKGANVEAFDLSTVGVDRANRAAARYGIADRVHFTAADANNLPFADGRFDLIIGWGVLHHLVKYPEAARELARVVKPGGRLVWQETWGENPILNVGRRCFTMAAEDAGDVLMTYSILRVWSAKDLRIAYVRHLSLCYMMKRFMRPSRRPNHQLLLWQRIVLMIAQAADAVLTRIPGIRRLGAEAVIVLERV